MSQNNNHSGGKNARRKDVAIEMELPLTAANKIRCISHVRSHTSSLADTMWLPSLRRKSNVESPKTPDVSIAIGRKPNLSVKDSYLLCFLDPASLAAAQAELRSMLDGLNMSIQLHPRLGTTRRQ